MHIELLLERIQKRRPNKDKSSSIRYKADAIEATRHVLGSDGWGIVISDVGRVNRSVRTNVPLCCEQGCNKDMYTKWTSMMLSTQEAAT